MTFLNKIQKIGSHDDDDEDDDNIHSAFFLVI